MMRSTFRYLHRMSATHVFLLCSFGAALFLPCTALATASIAGRHIFYNGSAWDGNSTAANTSDDAAIATDKSALLPGQTQATFSNYTSYSNGINGIMVDIAGTENLAGITASDFSFKSGNTNDPSGWSGESDPNVTMRAGAGAGGSDRITLIWANTLIQKKWLQVTVKATANTGLAADDLFYFGNAIGESGNSTTETIVDAVDRTGAANNPHTFLDPAPIIDAYDFNRDKKVDANDRSIVTANETTTATMLYLLDWLPPTVSALSPADNAANVATSANLIVTFNEAVRAGTGTLTIRKTDDDTAVEAIAVSGALLSGNGTTTLALDPATLLVESTGYYVVWEANAFKDTAGNPAARQSSTTYWSFETADESAPAVSALSPADNATDVATDASLRITFNEVTGTTGTGYVTLYKASDDSIVERINTATGAVTGSGTATVTIDPSATLLNATAYYVQIDGMAFPDATGNSFTGIGDSTTWNFTTVAAAAASPSSSSSSSSPATAMAGGGVRAGTMARRIEQSIRPAAVSDPGAHEQDEKSPAMIILLKIRERLVARIEKRLAAVRSVAAKTILEGIRERLIRRIDARIRRVGGG